MWGVRRLQRIPSNRHPSSAGPLSLRTGKGVAYDLIDGANADNKDIRAKLWGISGKRAVYPQLFARLSSTGGGGSGSSGEYRFICDWAALEFLVENNEEQHGLDAALAGLERKK
jgi:hypothetical protein